MKQLSSATLDIYDALSVDVEATFTKGLPAFSIVGLANSTIAESKDRVRSALVSNGFKFPPLKITINLSPSDISKSGTHFDLPIALLIALQNSSVEFGGYFVFGELGLDGKIKDTALIFPLVLSLAEQKIVKKVLVPKDSAPKLSLIPGLELYCVDTLDQALEFFKSDNTNEYRFENRTYEHKFIEVLGDKFYYKNNYELDFKEVKGQQRAKRAALISSAGNHNILFEGSPGCGKSMISKRMTHIMPPMGLGELLQKAKLDSVDLKEPDFEPLRAFRSPHHSATKASIFGGGSKNAKVGEVSLANGGILFFDELPHFSKSILEAMREPLEDHRILVSRVNSKIEYDTKFLFISAMNPCPCGNLLAASKECRCNDLEVQRYKNRLSDPFLDRIDLYVVMNEVSGSDQADVDSKSMHEKVIGAFAMQKKRGQKELNGKLSDRDILEYCILDEDAGDVLDRAVANFKLSFRAINKIKKVARTIADIQNSKNIAKSHVMEALSFRKR